MSCEAFPSDVRCPCAPFRELLCGLLETAGFEIHSETVIADSCERTNTCVVSHHLHVPNQTTAPREHRSTDSEGDDEMSFKSEKDTISP